jgi:predicted permease
VRAGGHDEKSGRIVLSRLLDAIRAEPGITAAGLSAFLPLTLIDRMSWNADPDGHQMRKDEPRAFAVNVVTGDYFRTLGIPMIAGREFDGTDAAADPHLVVNDTFARRFWGSPAAALGKGVTTGNKHWTIVGVARDIKYARLDEPPRPYMYVPLSQWYSASMTLQVRATADSGAILARIREDAQRVDPAMAVLQSGSMTDTLRSASSVYETLARVLTLIGTLAVGIAAFGVYGLVAYTIKLKAHEIGVRAALGAPRSSIVWSFLRRGGTLAATGTAAGVILSLAVSRLMTTLLFGVAATDLASFTIATVVVASSAMLASLLPAWRAANVDPIATLRHR